MSKRKAERPPPAQSPALAAVGRLLTLAEVAELLGLNKRTVERMLVRRELTAIRVGHGRGALRVSEAELLRLIAAGRERA